MMYIKTKKPTTKEKKMNEAVSGFTALAGILLAVVLGACSFTCVPVGERGVVKQFGRVKHEKTLNEGLHLIVPVITSVQDINVKLIEFSNLNKASSKDLQDVQTEVTITYSLNEPSQLVQNVGDHYLISDILFKPAVEESVKAVTAQYTAEQLITERPKVKVDIQKEISKFLLKTLNRKKLNNSVLSIANVAITDFSFSKEFNESIEMKVKAEQQALQAKNEKQKKITDAEALARSITLESIAKANAIKREAKALKENPLLIEFRRLERWNGQLPRVTGGYIPMFDVMKTIGEDNGKDE